MRDSVNAARGKLTMPFIESGVTPLQLSIAVRAAMHWPADAERRRQFSLVEEVRARLLADPGADFAVSADVLRGLLEAPAHSALKEELGSLTKRAYTAAFVFLFMFLLDRLRDQLPRRGAAGASLSKARFLAGEWAKTGAPFGDGGAMPTSETAVDSCWKDFRTVSHLWAAVEMNRLCQYAPPREIFHPEHIGSFLSTAAYLQEFGMSFQLDNRAGRKAETLLPAADSWLVDTKAFKPRILLPADEAEAFADAPFMALLKRYTADKNR